MNILKMGNKDVVVSHLQLILVIQVVIELHDRCQLKSSVRTYHEGNIGACQYDVIVTFEYSCFTSVCQ